MGTIASGENKTCTITNDDVAPQLTVKVLVTNNCETVSAANFSVSGTEVSPAAFPGSADGTLVTLDAGSYSAN